MSILASPRFLRSVLYLDAAVCLLSVPALLAFSEPLAQLTGLPGSALTGVAVINLLFGLLISFVATRAVLPRRGVMAVVILNALWGLESIVLVFLGWFPLTGLGQTLVIGQGVAALIAADLEYMGLRRLQAAPQLGSAV